MATSVTVLGASGSTVTIPFTSAANAAAAQNALGLISTAVHAALLTQYQYAGSVPSVPGGVIGAGLVISGNSPVDTGLLPIGYVSVVSNSTAGVPTLTGGSSPVAVTLPATTVVGTYNPMTVVSGTSGIVFLNVSSNASIFLGGGMNLIAEGTSASNAVINTDGATVVDARLGASTINAFTNSAVAVVGGGAGTAIVNALGDNTVALSGNAGGTALTVNGAAGGNIGFIGSAGMPALLDLNGANVTVAANSGNFTLQGAGSNVLVFENHGFIQGGAGTNYLIGDSMAGATTLVGGGQTNTLIGQGSGNLYVVTGASNYIADLSSGYSAGGATYNTSGGTSTVFGSLASNSTFNAGAGASTLYGQHGVDLSRGNTYTDAYNGANTITIGDFVEGHDVFSLTHSTSGATLSSITYYADAGTSTFGAVGTEAILSDGTKVDFLHFNVDSKAFT